MSNLIKQLQKQAAGKFSQPADGKYQSAVRIFNSAIDTRPEAVLHCQSAQDVALGVNLARDLNLGLSVRGGGHNTAGLALRGGGLLLDTSGWRNVVADPVTRRARSAPGATWADYDAVTQEHKLGSPGGVVSSTGVFGLTLSGGIGALRARHGLACDNVRSFDIVLADGSIATADAERHPDLFWAVRGGGSNFGILTELEFEIHPVDRVVTGMLVWPLAQAMSVFEHYAKIAPTLTDDCVVDFFLVRFPQSPPTLVAVPRYIGTMAQAQAELEPLRRFLSPQDNLAEMSYCDSQKFLDAVTVWDLRQLWRTQTLRDLDLGAMNVLVEFFARAPSPMSAIIIEHLKGGVHRVGPTDTAVGFRGATMNLMLTAQWVDPADDAVNQAWVRELGEAVSRFPAIGAYANYLPQDADARDVQRAYGVNHARLQSVKATYDADNFFRCNQNILPRH